MQILETAPAASRLRLSKCPRGMAYKGGCAHPAGSPDVTSGVTDRRRDAGFSKNEDGLQYDTIQYLNLDEVHSNFNKTTLTYNTNK